MNRARSTVASYLQAFLRHEQIADPSAWVEPDRVRQIESALEAAGRGPLKAVYERLGGAVSYDEIRIVATCVANRE